MAHPCTEIARAAEDPDKYNLIMNVVSERLQMRDENWRLCYKALLLLEFLVKHGPWVGGTGPKLLRLVRSDRVHHAGYCVPPYDVNPKSKLVALYHVVTQCIVSPACITPRPPPLPVALTRAAPVRTPPHHSESWTSSIAACPLWSGCGTTSNTATRRARTRCEPVLVAALVTTTWMPSIPNHSCMRNA